jgi:two-component system, chemotaxis family, chemotaxis protein CheY
MKGLILEASPLFQSQVANAFRSAGWENPIIAPGIPEAMRLFDGSVDFIVTDGNGSHLRSLGLARRLRTLAPTGATPLILATNQRGHESITTAMAAGATAVVVRPYGIDALLSTILDSVHSGETSMP